MFPVHSVVEGEALGSEVGSQFVGDEASYLAGLAGWGSFDKGVESWGEGGMMRMMEMIMILVNKLKQLCKAFIDKNYKVYL